MDAELALLEAALDYRFASRISCAAR